MAPFLVGFWVSEPQRACLTAMPRVAGRFCGSATLSPTCWLTSLAWSRAGRSATPPVPGSSLSWEPGVCVPARAELHEGPGLGQDTHIGGRGSENRQRLSLWAPAYPSSPLVYTHCPSQLPAPWTRSSSIICKDISFMESVGPAS